MCLGGVDASPSECVEKNFEGRVLHGRRLCIIDRLGVEVGDEGEVSERR